MRVRVLVVWGVAVVSKDGRSTADLVEWAFFDWGYIHSTPVDLFAFAP